MTQPKFYHEGELRVQARIGVSREAQMVAGAVEARIPTPARSFIEQQNMAVLGSLDTEGRVWASVVFGNPGFLQAVDEACLRLRREGTVSARGDPLWRNLETRPQLGMLLIELTSRRRLRVNGRARFDVTGDCLIDVQRAYANCPKYIQRRRLELPDALESGSLQAWCEGRLLTPEQEQLISQADTFFVASAHPEQGADVSHRGGHPGFVRVLNRRRLRIPDFVGNNMFNTLGNFESYPSAGLVFIDFERDRMLQLSGLPKLLLAQADELGETGGTTRYWELEIETWRESSLPLRLEWEFLDSSPHIPNLRKGGGRSPLRLRIARTWMETSGVKGFQLVAADGAELPPFEPGAHLPVRVRDGRGDWVQRHYSLLSDPADRSSYRIGVRLEAKGRGGSRYLHEYLAEGELLQATEPRNDFPLQMGTDHSILLAGGIGITPMISMIHALKAAGRSFELHYSVRQWSGLAFRGEIESLAGDRARFYVSAEPGQERLDLPRILARPGANTHLYVCGPRGLILDVRRLAREEGWSDEQVHFESFGAAPLPGDRELSVELIRSGLTIEIPASQTILDGLLEQGLEVPHECKRGECSLCATKVLGGEPDHRDLCLSPQEQADSMCICVSRAKTERLWLDL